MTMAARSVVKETVFKKTFATLPEILIQDPIHECSYHIPAARLSEYRTGPDAWTQLTPETVTFVIPGTEAIEEVPPFVASADNEPSVLIQFPTDQSSYLLSWDELQQFQIDQPTEYWDGFEGVSFVMPRGMELIEQLPALRRAALQSGT
jgi:hypothetical protein